MPDNWTVKQLLEWTTEYFRKGGLDEPVLSAQLLLAKAMGCSKVDLYLRFNQQVNKSVRDKFRQLVRRAYQGEPIAYILGEKEFFSLTIKVNPSVLIPRPETELIVQWVVRKSREMFSDGDKLDILDIGTGSGCIAIALAKNLPVEAKIIACDISDDALSVAEENRSAHNLEDKITFVKSELFENIRPESKFDFIVSNPPYVTERDYQNLPKQIKEYEPACALLGGEDGLDVIRRIIKQAKDYLKPEGWLVFEIGYDQKPAVESLLKEGGYSDVEFEVDSSNIPRVAIAQINN